MTWINSISNLFENENDEGLNSVQSYAE